MDAGTDIYSQLQDLLIFSICSDVKDGDGGFIRCCRPFFIAGGITVLSGMIRTGVCRHPDGENILLTRRRIYANILLDF